MSVYNYFGYKCPKCNSTLDVAVAGESLLCPNCRTEMVPDEKGSSSSANVFCRNCNAAFGLINSDRCPICGRPFSE